MKFIYQEAFIGTFSHEQMTPLNSILNLTDVLIQKQDDEDITSNEDLHLLTCISNSAKIMKMMNQSFLECQNYDQKKLEKNMEELYSPTAFMRELIDICEPQIKQRGITIEFDYAKIEREIGELYFDQEKAQLGIYHIF